MSFPCNQCGWCCQNLDKNKLYSTLDRGDGVCKWFDTKNKNCTIYNTRPEICNIEKMYHSTFSAIDYDEYIRLNIQVCQSVQQENKLPIIQI
ncbi:YkgJ family cysteine cluster protein [Psychrobacter sp. PL19]|uniref:YkgJ family cysteine cluster protein n=1 Tax=Psychrobacter sp. PL19 TaxID=2760711 RepID=UPI003FA7411A